MTTPLIKGQKSMYLMDYQKKQLLIDAMGMHLGDTSRNIACPMCGVDGSFSVTKKHDGILYNCYRASCGTNGFVYSNGSSILRLPDKSHETSKVNTNPFKGEQSELPKEMQEYLTHKYEITAYSMSTQGWMYEESTHRLIMPLINYFGRRYGVVCKKLPGSSFMGPKAVNYIEEEGNLHLHFPKYNKDYVVDNSVVVIVEDSISATKISTSAPAVALLGTVLGAKEAAFLSSHYRKVLLMLDPDANSKALTISGKYRSLFDMFKVITMADDPKDTKMENLDTTIYSSI